MQTYKSHKTVEAAKIVAFDLDGDGGAILGLQGDRTETREGVTKNWLDQRAPGWGTTDAEVELVGGYFIRYADGYTSWSPAEAFEAGYTAISTEAQGLPVAGYKPTQPQWAIAEVNGFKVLEERVLRQLDYLQAAPEMKDKVDGRMLAVGRTQLQLAFMAINRAIFQPGRITLPEDDQQALDLDVGHGAPRA